MLLNFQLALRGVGRFFADDPNTVEVPAQNILSATVSVPHPIALTNAISLRWFLAVENIFNRKHIASAFTNPDMVSGVPVAFEPGAPRSVILSLSLSRGR